MVNRAWICYYVIDHKLKKRLFIGTLEFYQDFGALDHHHYIDEVNFTADQMYHIIKENLLHVGILRCDLPDEINGCTGATVLTDAGANAPCYPAYSRISWTYQGQNTNGFTFQGIDWNLINNGYYTEQMSTYEWVCAKTYPRQAESWEADSISEGIVNQTNKFPNWTAKDFLDWYYFYVIDKNLGVEINLKAESLKYSEKVFPTLKEKGLSWSEANWAFDEDGMTSYFGNIGFLVPATFQFWGKSIHFYDKHLVCVGSLSDTLLNSQKIRDVYTISYTPIIILTPLAAFGRTIANKQKWSESEVNELVNRIRNELITYTEGWLLASSPFWCWVFDGVYYRPIYLRNPDSMFLTKVMQYRTKNLLDVANHTVTRVLKKSISGAIAYMTLSVLGASVRAGLRMEQLTWMERDTRNRVWETWNQFQTFYYDFKTGEGHL